jgi:hypothetical protein
MVNDVERDTVDEESERGTLELLASVDVARDVEGGVVRSLDSGGSRLTESLREGLGRTS